MSAARNPTKPCKSKGGSSRCACAPMSRAPRQYGRQLTMAAQQHESATAPTADELTRAHLRYLPRVECDFPAGTRWAGDFAVAGGWSVWAGGGLTGRLVIEDAAVVPATVFSSARLLADSGSAGPSDTLSAGRGTGPATPPLIDGGSKGALPTEPTEGEPFEDSSLVEGGTACSALRLDDDDDDDDDDDSERSSSPTSARSCGEALPGSRARTPEMTKNPRPITATIHSTDITNPELGRCPRPRVPVGAAARTGGRRRPCGNVVASEDSASLTS